LGRQKAREEGNLVVKISTPQPRPGVDFFSIKSEVGGGEESETLWGSEAEGGTGGATVTYAFHIKEGTGWTNKREG